MLWRALLFVLAALAGILLFAVGGAWHSWPVQIAGLVLEVVCLVAGWRWFASRQRPPEL